MSNTAKESAATRGMGGKRVARFPVSTTSEFHNKLKMLSYATGHRDISRLADEILRIGLNSPQVVYYLQEKYGEGFEDKHVKVLSVKNNGKEEVIYS